MVGQRDGFIDNYIDSYKDAVGHQTKSTNAILTDKLR